MAEKRPIKPPGFVLVALYGGVELFGCNISATTRKSWLFPRTPAFRDLDTRVRKLRLKTVIIKTN